MKTTPLLLIIPLLMTAGALAASQDDFNVQTASSRAATLKRPGTARG